MLRKAIAVVVLFVALAPSAQSTKVIPPEVKDLHGNWLGQSDDGVFVRLQLSATGRGTLAINYYPNQPIWTYQVAVVKPKDRLFVPDLEFKLTPTGDSQPIQLIDGKGSRGKISFKMKGDPFNVYTLTPELEALSRINRLIKNNQRRP